MGAVPAAAFRAGRGSGVRRGSGPRKPASAFEGVVDRPALATQPPAGGAGERRGSFRHPPRPRLRQIPPLVQASKPPRSREAREVFLGRCRAPTTEVAPQQPDKPSRPSRLRGGTEAVTYSSLMAEVASRAM